MNAIPHPQLASVSLPLPLPLAREVEAAYQRFESAWRAGERPRIEDHLSGLSELARPVLFPEFLELELSYRRRGGETVRPEEYWQRFPEYAAQMESILRENAAEVTALEQSSEDNDALPTHLGRYRVMARLGAGGCGVVYKAQDDDLQREVAVKVPHRHRIATAADIDAYLAEARMLATLDHPGIVPVYDMGRTADGLCYVVSKFVAGHDLRTRLKQGRLAYAKVATLVAQVAEALHHAHRRRLVHRDVKPANILLDEQGRPVVADFGLALRDVDFGTGPQLAGTPAYMSPEQARGEGHRVDARSDIYSLGVVFYELLTGQRPYRSESPEQVLEEIKTHEPRPPRLLNDAVPAELDRICLRALAKRAADRYSTAQDLADDLRDWLAAEPGVRGPGSGIRDPEEAASRTPPGVRGQGSGVRDQEEAASLPPDSCLLTPAKVVPKGLRAYDAADAEFFLELLPGPRDRHGLPDSLRFWKQRIEETDASQTFAVGLVYGPSGCGKSSLVKAGLLPRLAAHIQVVYVEATPDETETRLLKGLRRRRPELSEKLGLVETLAELRRRGTRVAGSPRPAPRAPRPAKVLLVLDQFEQWLHAKRSEQHTELVQSLRQCDGEHVQCLVLVRDDFGMAAARFMNELEIRILEGHNFATVDLFDLSHARNVLEVFGRAFGQLPAGELSPEQARFLDQAVAGLAQDGKVISVRLALFAEMVKSKPWTSATMRQVGGAEGVGVTFLEETFSASTAPPTHRLHQDAARAVLKALLPEPGADLKGHMRSRQELQDAAGYAGRPKDFADLVYILDTELRLVTPTEGGEAGAREAGAREAGARGEGQGTSTSGQGLAPEFYQLTHDYLVSALRQWLTRKQRETREGRMELLLAERASLWAVKQDSRQLPGWWEWLNILLWTRSANRTQVQRQLLRAASRKRLFQAGLLVLFASLFTWVLWEVYRGPVKADYLVRSLMSADIKEVDEIIKEMADCRRWANPKLQALIAGMAESPSSPKEKQAKLNVSLALLPEPAQMKYLVEKQLLDPMIEPDEARVVALLLRRHYRAEVAAQLRAFLEKDPLPVRSDDQGRSPGPPTADHRCRVACALAFIQPDNWREFSDQVVDELVKKDLPSARKWASLPMEGVGTPLGESLEKIIWKDANRTESERAHAAALTEYSFLTYNRSSTKRLMDLVLEIEGEPYRILIPWFIASGQEAAAEIERALDNLRGANPKEMDDLARRQAHAAVVLVQLEEWDSHRGPLGDQKDRISADRAWSFLQDSADPRLHSLRSYLIRRFARVGTNPEVVVKRYMSESDTSARRALLLGLGGYKDYRPPLALVQRLEREYRDDPDAGIHSALDWLLRRWQQQSLKGIGRADDIASHIEKINRTLATGKVEGNRRWYVTAKHGHTMAVVGPAKFTMGSPEDEQHRRPVEKQHLRHIPRSFAIATKEVTLRQFREFLRANRDVHGWGPAEREALEREPDNSPVLDCPVVGVSWFVAAQYCRWLSEQEGISEDQMCYRTVVEIKEGMALPADCLTRTGYRLPTEAEWEYACRAGAVTSRPYGSADALLDQYAWYDRNSQDRAKAVGGLRPNDLGLFDMLGNAWEWCHSEALPYPHGPVEVREQPGPVTAAKQRVLRGGGFFTAPPELRAANRIEHHPQMSHGQAGLRVARTRSE